MVKEISTIIIAGKNDIAVDATGYVLERFSNKRLLIIPNRTDAGVDGQQRSLLKFVRSQSLEVIDIEDAYALEDAMFVSLEYDRLVHPSRFKSKRLVNIHFSALPKYKGMYTSAWPLRLGENESGVTLHEIDPGIDTGPIIAQRRFPIAPDDNCKDLYLKYIATGTLLFKANLERLVLGKYSATAQPVERSTYFSKTSIDFSNPVIDLFQTAITIKNQIRSFTFRDYQLPIVRGCRVFGCEILKERNFSRPGTLLEEDDDSFRFSTVDYSVRIFKDRLSELMESCRAGDLDGVQRYLRNNALLNEQDRTGKTPLINAVEMGQLEIVRHLCAAGARVDVRSNDRRLPIDYVAELKSEGLRRAITAEVMRH